MLRLLSCDALIHRPPLIVSVNFSFYFKRGCPFPGKRVSGLRLGHSQKGGRKTGKRISKETYTTNRLIVRTTKRFFITKRAIVKLGETNKQS